MKASLVNQPTPAPAFERFEVHIWIENRDELLAFTRAASTLCNGHGLELYPLLQAKCEQAGISKNLF